MRTKRKNRSKFFGFGIPNSKTRSVKSKTKKCEFCAEDNKWGLQKVKLKINKKRSFPFRICL